jgi:hypothetical protein
MGRRAHRRQLNFVRGIEDWAVSIGLLDKGEAHCGRVTLQARGIAIAGADVAARRATTSCWLGPARRARIS